MPYKGSSKYHGPSRESVTASTGDGNDYTATEDDEVILADTTSSVLTVTLPTAGAVDGKRYEVQDVGGNAATNAITVSAEGGENVNGSDQDLTISSNYGRLVAVSDGDAWYVTTSAP